MARVGLKELQAERQQKDVCAKDPDIWNTSFWGDGGMGKIRLRAACA